MLELETLALRVTSVAALALLANTLLFRGRERSFIRRLRLALAGLGVGTVLWHAVLCLFGAPLTALVPQTLLLALLLASLTTTPAAICLGLRARAWVDVIVHLRVRSAEEAFLATSTIGAALGAYVGALPIPLDWDRPWQVAAKTE
ncbi:hypothetical protein PybrP1_010906 [[Pythium] brassicae (nom. inval.)]|nr:hypothetical protein PybrP1_010906 [[Pythium] brassicae (nom. inval.)]